MKMNILRDSLVTNFTNDGFNKEERKKLKCDILNNIDQYINYVKSFPIVNKIKDYAEKEKIIINYNLFSKLFHLEVDDEKGKFLFSLAWRSLTTIPARFEADYAQKIKGKLITVNKVRNRNVVNREEYEESIQYLNPCIFEKASLQEAIAIKILDDLITGNDACIGPYPEPAFYPGAIFFKDYFFKHLDTIFSDIVEKNWEKKLKWNEAIVWLTGGYEAGLDCLDEDFHEDLLLSWDWGTFPRLCDVISETYKKERGWS